MTALACKIEENTRSVKEVASKFAELIRSPYLKRRKKRGEKSTFFYNECERKKEELNHMLEYVKKSEKEIEKLDLLRHFRRKKSIN